MEDPAAALPVGIVGAVVIAAALYVALSAVLCGMVPYGDIQTGAPFSQAFLSLLDPATDGRLRAALLRTSARFVSFGAITGAPREPARPPDDSASTIYPILCQMDAASMALHASWPASSLSSPRADLLAGWRHTVAVQARSLDQKGSDRG